MVLSTVLTTVLGAVIGVGSAFLLDRTRVDRERRDRAIEQRRMVYAEYLSALARTRNDIRLAAHRSNAPLEIRITMAEEAFKQGQAYELRYQMSLLAPPHLVAASDVAFRSLRRVRDIVVAGGVQGEPEYVAARNAWEKAFSNLRREMRRDLGIQD